MTPSTPDKPNLQWRRLLIVAVIVSVALFLRWNESSQTVPPNDRLPSENSVTPAIDDDLPVIPAEQTSNEIREEKAAVEVSEVRAARVGVDNVTLKDQSGRTIFRGDVDLMPTLDRIADGELLDQFRNDGSVFQNRERRLPQKPAGYYREYVVPTDGQSGPGPQRLVIGEEGEAYYTHDHYKSFRKIR